MKLSAVIVAALFSLASAQSSSAPSPSGSASASASPSPSSSSSSSGGGGAIISVTAPLQGASYKAGDKAIISWINPSVQAISQIVLAKGGSSSLQPVTTIATNVPAASGSYTWNIPADLPAGTDYAFEFGTSPNLAFTGQFSITGGSGAGSSVPSGGAAVGTNSTSVSSSSPSSPSSGSSKPSTGSSASGSGSAAQASSSSAANSLTSGSIVVIGAAVVAIAQVF